MLPVNAKFPCVRSLHACRRTAVQRRCASIMVGDYKYETVAEGAAVMARKPPRKRPKKAVVGEHITLEEPGYYLLPDLVRIEGINPGRWLHVLDIVAFTGWGQRLHLPITSQAIASLAV